MFLFYAAPAQYSFTLFSTLLVATIWFVERLQSFVGNVVSTSHNTSLLQQVLETAIFVVIWHSNV